MAFQQIHLQERREKKERDLTSSPRSNENTPNTTFIEWEETPHDSLGNPWVGTSGQDDEKGEDRIPWDDQGMGTNDDWLHGFSSLRLAENKHTLQETSVSGDTSLSFHPETEWSNSPETLHPEVDTTHEPGEWVYDEQGNPQWKDSEHWVASENHYENQHEGHYEGQQEGHYENQQEGHYEGHYEGQYATHPEYYTYPENEHAHGEWDQHNLGYTSYIEEPQYTKESTHIDEGWDSQNIDELADDWLQYKEPTESSPCSIPCPQCQQPNTANANFCSNCGNRMMMQTSVGNSSPISSYSIPVTHDSSTANQAIHPYGTFKSSHKRTDSGTSLGRNVWTPTSSNFSSIDSPLIPDVPEFMNAPTHSLGQKTEFYSTLPPESMNASTIANDPFVRGPHAVISFGFGGKVVITFPKLQQRYDTRMYSKESHANFAIPSMDTPKAVYLPSFLKVYALKDLLRSHPIIQALSEFPGPLRTKQYKDAVKYMEKRISSIKTEHQDSDESLLWKILGIYCDSDGQIINNPNAENIVREILLKGLGSVGINNQVAKEKTYPNGSTHFQGIQDDLFRGRKKEACEKAIEIGLWAHAFLIADMTDPTLLRGLGMRYVQECFPEGHPIRLLYLAHAQDNDGVHRELQNFTRNDVHDIKKWRHGSALFMSNKTTNNNFALLQLGDLLSIENKHLAAQVCYILSGVPIDALDQNPLSKKSRMVLIGADHCNNPRFWKDVESIQRTEIFELAKRKANSQFSLSFLLLYKYFHALILAEFGFYDKAAAYCEFVLAQLKSNARATPLFPKIHLYQLQELDFRIQNAKQAITASQAAGSGWLPKIPQFQGLVDAFDRGLNRLLNGESSTTTNSADFIVANSRVSTPIPIAASSGESDLTVAPSVPSIFAAQPNHSSSSSVDMMMNFPASTVSPIDESQLSLKPTLRATHRPSYSDAENNMKLAQDYRYFTNVQSNSVDSTMNASPIEPKSESFGSHVLPSQPIPFIPPVPDQSHILASQSESFDVNSLSTRKNENSFTKVSDSKEASVVAPGGLFKRLGSLFVRRKESVNVDDNPVEARLGEENAFRYDPIKKRWINTKDVEGSQNDDQPLAPPPVSAKISIMPNMHYGLENSDINTQQSSNNSPLIVSNGHEISTTNHRATHPGLKGKGKVSFARSRYVDTFNPIHSQSSDVGTTELPIVDWAQSIAPINEFLQSNNNVTLMQPIPDYSESNDQDHAFSYYQSFSTTNRGLYVPDTTQEDFSTSNGIHLSSYQQPPLEEPSDSPANFL